MSSEMMRNERLERPLARRMVALLFVRESPSTQDSRHDSRIGSVLPIMRSTESAPDVPDRTLAIWDNDRVAPRSHSLEARR